MLHAAGSVLPADRVRLIVGDIEDALPEDRSILWPQCSAVHHLESAAKADLFRRVHERLVPGGLFVLGDAFLPPEVSRRLSLVLRTGRYIYYASAPTHSKDLQRCNPTGTGQRDPIGLAAVPDNQCRGAR